MGKRVSGKNALVQMVDDPDNTQTTFDISGTDTDGRSRANSFSFTIAGNVAEAMGYNEDGVEPVPTGQTRVNGSMTVFYNSDTDEVEDYLWSMYDAQHAPDACTDVEDRDMYIFPEGNCSGTTKWTLDRVVINDLDFQFPVDGLAVINFNFQAWKASRATVS
jgi:hypothetical protein